MHTLINKYSDEQIRDLLSDPVIIKIVEVLDRASLSILELLEFGITRKEVNHALAKDIISFDRTPDRHSTNEYGSASGDYYFSFLSTKVRLTDLGIFILHHIQTE